MVPFTFFEGVFFMSVGIVFFLGGALFYFFKKRIETLEKSNETLGNICKTMVSELESFKHFNHNETMPKYLDSSNANYQGGCIPTKLNVIQEVNDDLEDEIENDKDESEEENDSESDDNSSDTTTLISGVHEDMISIVNEIEIVDNVDDNMDIDVDVDVDVDVDDNVKNDEVNENKEYNTVQDNNETNLEKNEEMTFHEQVIAIEHDNLEYDRKYLVYTILTILMIISVIIFVVYKLLPDLIKDSFIISYFVGVLLLVFFIHNYFKV